MRRVKSMIFEGGKDDEVDAGQRAKVMMRKQVKEVTPSQIAMLPSPLLSAEDAGSLKVSLPDSNPDTLVPGTNLLFQNLKGASTYAGQHFPLVSFRPFIPFVGGRAGMNLII